MSKGIRAVIDNTVATLEATVADTLWASTTGFRYAPNYKPDKDNGEPTRLFLVSPTGSRTMGGHQLTHTTPFVVTAILNVVVSYVQGDDPDELLKVMQEDVDRIAYALCNINSYDGNNTGLSLRDVGDFEVELDAGPGGCALLTIPVKVMYGPTMT